MALALQDPPGNPCQQGGAKSSENAQTASQRFMVVHVKNYSTSSQGQFYMSFSMLSTLSTLSKPSLLQKFQLAWPWPFPDLHLHLLPKSLPFWLGGYCRNSSDFNVMKAWMQVQVDTVDTRIIYMSDCCQSCKLIPSGIAAATSCRETVILVSLVPEKT